MCMMMIWLRIWFWAAAVFLAAGAGRAELPQHYPAMFDELSALIDGGVLRPMEMVRGGWLATQCLAPAAKGLEFNREQFVADESLGKTAVSGLFLAVHGRVQEHLFVCRELESNLTKRYWMWINFGTEDQFFLRLNAGKKYQPLTSLLPSAKGVRMQLRFLMQSKDALTRRAGLFWGSWFVNDAYWWGVERMASQDPDSVNRICAARLLKMMR